jgi:CubicO group peptidase (beta-lactamase class C family)
MANAEQALANTPPTMFGLESVTKEFTAMAILILQERNKLHVQDPICTYISSCPQAWQPITLIGAESSSHSSKKNHWTFS